eukprot:4256664-Alexandrium_andersonii.AAC.1
MERGESAACASAGAGTWASQLLPGDSQGGKGADHSAVMVEDDDDAEKDGMDDEEPKYGTAEAKAAADHRVA